jgi:hypothetical protein
MVYYAAFPIHAQAEAFIQGILWGLKSPVTLEIKTSLDKWGHPLGGHRTLFEVWGPPHLQDGWKAFLNPSAQGAT